MKGEAKHQIMGHAERKKKRRQVSRLGIGRPGTELALLAGNGGGGVSKGKGARLGWAILEGKGNDRV